MTVPGSPIKPTEAQRCTRQREKNRLKREQLGRRKCPTKCICLCHDGPLGYVHPGRYCFDLTEAEKE